MSSKDTTPRPNRPAQAFPALKSQAEYAATPARVTRTPSTNAQPPRSAPRKGIERAGMVLVALGAGVVATGVAWAGF